MEQQDQRTTTRDERRSLALAALIMSFVALFCAFFKDWRTLTFFISGLAFIVAVFVLTKVRHGGPSKTMSVLAVAVSLAGAALAIYMLSATRAQQNARTEIPAELRDSVSRAPDESTLERLQNSMDSTQAEK